MYSDIRTCFGGPHDGIVWETVSLLDPETQRFVYICSEDLRFVSTYERRPHPITGQNALVYWRTDVAHHA